ncbi:MAG: hypothetical protein JO192_03055 [Candidatus Eremiobacteraeota bacterium]|nr:hypothetical protein [Candidatus Eremiobacteraeota bacterium]
MKPRIAAALSLAMTSALLAACSSAGTAPATYGVRPAHGLGYLHAVVRVPSKRASQWIARALLKKRVKPAFLPADTTEIDFNLIAVQGVATSPSNPYNVVLLPQTSPHCATQSPDGGYACSITVAAPAATDTYQIVACSGTTTGCGGGKGLSEAWAQFAVPVGGVANGTFSLNPIVAALKWQSGDGFANGAARPVYSQQTQQYSCATSCYDPLLDDAGVALGDTLTLVALDADNETIIPASGGGSGASSPNVPLYLTAAGAVDTITIACNNPHVTYLNAAPSLPLPSPVPATNYANGVTGATYPQITSPVTGQDGSGTGTTFSGSAGTVYGNNGAYLNFDGGVGGTTFGPSSSVTCTATDSNSPAATATYYVGLAEGGLTWIINAKHT